MDCASAPALYESSAEYYSNEQKKSQKITQSLSKNQDLQHLADTNIRAETRRPTAIPVSPTTERVYRGRQRQQETPYVPQATARSYQALFPDPKQNNNPTQRSQLTTAFEKRRKSLVQLISNNFAVPARSTVPTYDASTLRTTPIDYNLKEMQVAAESASFAANNNNRQFLQDYHTKNYRPYPVYTPSTTTRKPERTRVRTNPNLTTLYDIREKQPSQTHYTHVSPPSTKRPTLVTYTKTYTTVNDNPYTRPGVSLLKTYIEKEKNRTTYTTAATPKHTQVAENTEPIEIQKITFKPRESFESATKIPTTRADVFYSQTASSDRRDVFSTVNQVAEGTTEPSYKERRERLIRKLNLDTYVSTEATVPTTVDKLYDDQANNKLNAPSLTPKTLHSLAIYYATALDNLSTTPTPDDVEVTTPAFDEYEAMEEALPALFSSNTINKYGSLFGHGASNAELLEEIKADPNATYNELMEDLMVQQSQSPLATSPQIRELAQVFTHALSAYLQDPVQFRKVLSDIRPTHPSFGENYGDLIGTTEDTTNTEPTTTINEEDDEILGFSEDNKARPISSFREPKALDLGTKFQSNSADSKYQSVSADSKYQTASQDLKYQTISETISTVPQYSTTVADVSTTPRPTEYVSTTYRSTTPRNPFICCGRISASYTSPSTPLAPSISPVYTNSNAYTINSLASEVSTTESSVPRYGGFQNNALTISDSQYGSGVTESKPLNEYVEATNLPTAWGVDTYASTPNSISTQDFESKKIRSTTVLPTTSTVYFTETDSAELENEEELQRAHSQSFIAPSGNSIRHGKQLNLEASTVRKPAEDLEAPTLSDTEPTTVQTTPTSTTIKQEDVLTTTPIPLSIFTSPDEDHQTSHFIWSTTFDNWHSTMLDPITLNDGLRTELEETNPTVDDSLYTGSTPTPTVNYATTESVSTTNNVEPATDDSKSENRRGKSLKDFSTEPSQDLSAITDTVVEKAKEIMNSTTTEKLMNVMKKTKSKTVKRLILLLVQTCDDDHNTTAEASKKALLEALMAVSQKDMEEIAKEEEGIVNNAAPEADSFRRTDRFLEPQEVRPRQDRRGKSIGFDPSAINSLSNPTTEKLQTTEQITVSTTPIPYRTSRRGVRKFASRTTPIEPRSTKPTFAETKPTFADTKPTFAATKATLPDTKPTIPDVPRAEARVAKESDLKTTSDARAIELLRSLYTIAARWG